MAASKLIARQHLLPSVAWLIDELSRHGGYSAIELFTKPYSEIAAVRLALPPSVQIRARLLDCLNSKDQALVLLDEGGGFHQELPDAFVACASGVEQTTFGIQKIWRYPVVLACRSAAKLIFESQVIARGILRKLDAIGTLDGNVMGVVGLGALGGAIARALLDRGIAVLGTDKTDCCPADLTHILTPIEELLSRSAVVLGCTGVDVLQPTAIASVGGERTFVSCSSSDIEFQSLVERLGRRSAFETAEGVIGKTFCRVLNGGYPINFDRSREWETFEEISLTRKLIMEALKQADSLRGSPAQGVMLNPHVQLQVTKEWLLQLPSANTIRLPRELSVEFFANNSEGTYERETTKMYTLHITTPAALERMRAHTEPYETLVKDLPILVLPGVWSPAYDWSSLFYVENMPDVAGRDFLEIGCGTGILSVFAGVGGAARVVATDINPIAIENTRRNFQRFGFNKGETFLSDGLENVRGEFDLITWNAPYHGSRPADMLEYGCADENYRAIRSFFDNVLRHLKPSGKILFGFSESGDLPLIRSLITKSGLRMTRTLSDWRQGYNCMLLELVREDDALIPNN